MATPYNEIIDLALVSIRDYKLDKLYLSSPTNFATYMKGFLIKAVPKFDNCKKNLANRDDALKQFDDTLDDTEKNILAEYTIVEWLTKEINDVSQITAMMQNNKEAKRFSEANLLDKKQALRDWALERIDRLKVSYDVKNTDWEGWSNNNYGI